MIAAARGREDRREEAARGAEDRERARVLQDCERGRERRHAGEQDERGSRRQQRIEPERRENREIENAHAAALQRQGIAGPCCAQSPPEDEQRDGARGDRDEPQLDRHPRVLVGVLEQECDTKEEHDHAHAYHRVAAEQPVARASNPLVGEAWRGGRGGLPALRLRQRSGRRGGRRDFRRDRLGSERPGRDARRRRLEPLGRQRHRADWDGRNARGFASQPPLQRMDAALQLLDLLAQVRFDGRARNLRRQRRRFVRGAGDPAPDEPADRRAERRRDHAGGAEREAEGDADDGADDRADRRCSHRPRLIGNRRAGEAPLPAALRALPARAAGLCPRRARSSRRSRGGRAWSSPGRPCARRTIPRGP